MRPWMENKEEDNNVRIVLILLSIIISLLMILSMFIGSAYVCSQFEGKLDPLLKCHSKEEVEKLNKPAIVFNESGYRVFDFGVIPNG
jgi:hypothetical protein